uniref:uncharacterized protein LOC120347672 n=1 Tax=Styela clava TaxID=7725 RepID=UPI00193ABD8B|nr:uncharacterized protein LOC120347672 [Styela clava]
MSDRLEDVVREAVRQFATTLDFTTFAQSGNGLSLSVQDVTTVIENHRFSVEEQKQKILWLWIEKHGSKATPQEIRNLIIQYYRSKHQGVATNVERLEDVFQDIIKLFAPEEFIQFARSGHGLSLTEHEIDTITENNRFAVEERSLKFLWKWRYSKYPYTNDAAVVERIKKLVGTYNDIKDEKNNQIKEQIRQKEISEAKDFLEVVENFTKQMLEFALKSVKEKTKMDNFVLPKVTEFKESESNKQTNLQSVDITRLHFDNSVNHVMLLGDTGSGKTTFAQRYVMLALEKRLVFTEEIKMVYFIDISKLQSDDRSTAFDLLFIQQLGSKLPKKLHKIGQEWLEQNSKHIVFVIDGLDQSQKPFESIYQRIGMETLAETNTIIANILSGHIYPGIKILSTSRWYVYWKLAPDIKAVKTLKLWGLDTDSVNLLAEKLFGSEAKRFIYALRHKSPGLFSNPMFFFYMARVFIDSQEIDVGTLTNLLVSVIRCFSGSRHGGRVDRLVPKLMKVAFYGMIGNRFVFKASYIKALNLDMNDMRGLVEIDADTEFVEYVADNDDMSIRFSHQSIQEILASLYACNLDLNEFKKFIENNYEKSEMEVVIKHAFGIILNKSTSEKAAKYLPDSLHIKYEYLLGYLDKLLEGKVLSDKRVVTLLHECGPDVIKKISSQIEELKFDGSMKLEEQHALLSVAKHIASLRFLQMWKLVIHTGTYAPMKHILCSVQNMYVRYLELVNCDADSLRILSEATKGGNIKIGWGFTIKESPAMNQVAYYHAIEIVHYGGLVDFRLDGCDLDAGKISKMNEAALDYGLNLEGFYVYNNQNMGTEAFAQLGRFLGIAMVKWSRLESVDLNADKLNKMNKKVVKYQVKLKSLYIDQNPNMNAEAFQQLAKLLKNTEAKYLSAQYCTPTSEQISALSTSLESEDVILSELLLRRSTTKPLTDAELLIVAKLVQKVGEIDFFDQTLNESQLRVLTAETNKFCSSSEIKCGSLRFIVTNPNLYTG